MLKLSLLCHLYFLASSLSPRRLLLKREQNVVLAEMESDYETTNYVMIADRQQLEAFVKERVS
jgi:hypothetical protein